jgi:endonuclease III
MAAKKSQKRTSRGRSRTPLRATPALAAWYYERLEAAYPDAHCALKHRNPFELLVATILSAQCTDVRVNQVTPELFARWPDAAALAQASLPEIEAAIRTTGFYHNKAKSIQGASRMIVEKFAGRVPHTMEQLLELPGVARKTANVVLGTAFGINDGVVVDTHVQRLSQRMGLSRQTDPGKIERDLMALFPRDQWTMLGHRLIFHGRRACAARKPACATCPVGDRCPRVGVVSG